MKNLIFKLFKAFFLIIVFQFFYFSHFKNPLNTISLKEWIEIGNSNRAQGNPPPTTTPPAGSDTGANENGGPSISISPVNAPVSESLHGDQKAYEIQSFSAMATNGTLLVVFGSQCASTWEATSCAMAAVTAAQLGVTIWAYLESKKNADDTEDPDPDDDEEEPPPNDDDPVVTLSAMLDQTRKNLQDGGWDVNAQTGEITDPEGNSFKLDSFDTEDLENQGFNSEAIKGLQAAKQKADNIAEAAYEAIKEDLTEQLENAEDPENFKFNLSSVGFNAYGGGGGSPVSYSKRSSKKAKGNSFSKFLKDLKKKKKKKKKSIRNPASLSKYKRLHGKDRIGSRGSSLFKMLSHRIKILKEKKLLKGL